MAKSYKIICTTILAAASVSGMAQNGINSPYSRYGFGMLSDRSMGFNKGMGGVAQGFRNGQEINVANPASYSAVDSLTALFDFGLSLYNGNYKMGKLQQNAKNSSFDYAAFHFRAAKGVGVAAGILPYSNIKYSFYSADERIEGVADNISSSYTFSGDGGLHQVFVGAGWQIVKPLSIGFNASYLYGSYSHKMALSFSESSINSINRGYTAEDIATYMLDLGLQYTMNLNKEDKLTLGLSYSLGHDMSGSAVRYTSTSNSGESRDSISNAFQLPHSFAAGLTYYHKNKLRVGADFELQKWSDVRFPTQETSINGGGASYISAKGLLNDKMRISVGADYIPNPFGRKYLNHVSYKIGGYYSKSYANADMTGTITDKPYEFGVSAGVAFPIINRNVWYNSPKVNVSLQWVHSNIPYLNSQTKRADKLTENYLKLCVGLTFSERWFYKWKVQ